MRHLSSHYWCSKTYEYTCVTVQPLYKGQVGDRSFVPYTMEPLTKDKLGTGYPVEPLYKAYSVEPLYRDKLGTGPLSLI